MTQVSGTFPALSDNEHKTLASQLKVKTKKQKKGPVNPFAGESGSGPKPPVPAFPTHGMTQRRTLSRRGRR